MLIWSTKRQDQVQICYKHQWCYHQDQCYTRKFKNLNTFSGDQDIAEFQKNCFHRMEEWGWYICIKTRFFSL